MEIEILEDKKQVHIWLTKETIRELLIYNMYRSTEKQLEKERGAEFPTGKKVAGLLAMEHSLAAERRRKKEEIQLKL